MKWQINIKGKIGCCEFSNSLIRIPEYNKEVNKSNVLPMDQINCSISHGRLLSATATQGRLEWGEWLRNYNKDEKENKMVQPNKYIKVTMPLLSVMLVRVW